MPSKVEWLIVGLGNPGKMYAYNRHNIGWMAATELAAKYKKPVMGLSPIYLQAPMRINSNLVLAILPTTYMNKSGEAVRKVSEMFDVPPERIVVVCDEYNFPLGKVHLRPGGGDGGHNGVESVIFELDTCDFLRLRCGIGNDFQEGGMVDYVLSNFKEEEIEQRDLMIKMAVESIECLVRHGSDRTMSLINSGELWGEEE